MNNLNDENNFQEYENLPIYKKAKEIYEVVSHIADLIPDDHEDSELVFVKKQMLVDAMTILVKIACAEEGYWYDLRMENATYIRKAALNLKGTKRTLRSFGFEEAQYFDMVRELIEEFRLLFIDWVAGFDQWIYVFDRWGLFNPPGIGPHNNDQNDDISFNFDDFLD